MRSGIMVALFSCWSVCAGAVEHPDHDHHQHHAAHTGRAPSGVMGDHVHKQGSWMFSYSYMRMHMDGLRDGSNHLSSAQVLADYAVTPLRMDMAMHMFSAMYALGDKLTLMAMLPLVNKEMEHITRTGARFTTRSDGVGDAELSAVYALRNGGRRQLLLNVGVSVPTGDIDATDDTPAMNEARLPYPMQPGSGSWGLLPGLTYTDGGGAYSWGAQARGTLRLADNDNAYRPGNRLELSAWTARRITPVWSLSLRVHGQSWGDVDGEDEKLNPAMVPTADAGLQAGTRLDLLAGATWRPGTTALRNSRLAIEVGAPLHEDLDGPQMSVDWIVNAGLQWVF